MQTSYLLNDHQVKQFLMNGYVQVKTELAEEVHLAAHEKTKKAFGPIVNFETDRAYNPGNNILPMVPELAQVMADPHVVGALTSLFGKNYLVHPHRHCHPNFPVASTDRRTTIMGIHKDGHADGNPKPRHRVPRWALVFYNPHPCPVQLGPTCISPGSHYYHRITTHGEREKNVEVVPSGDQFVLPENYVNRDFFPVASDLGTVSILHFDTVHSVITNISDMHRYAHKFVVMRTEDPDGSSWNSDDVLWDQADIGDRANHEIMWTYMWNWMNGRKNLFEHAHHRLDSLEAQMNAVTSGSVKQRIDSINEIGFLGSEAEAAVPVLIDALDDPADSVRLNAAYALGAIGAASVDALIEKIAHEASFYQEQPVLNVSEAVHALIAVGAPAVDALTAKLTSGEEHERAWAAFALGEIGAPAGSATPALLKLLGDSSLKVRRHALSALGIVGVPINQVEEALLKIFASDEEYDLRIYALQGLIRIGAGSPDTIDVLSKALDDPRPYIAAFAAEQLYRQRANADTHSLLTYLRPLRWFPYEIR